jgi:hypothetical protein
MTTPNSARTKRPFLRFTLPAALFLSTHALVMPKTSLAFTGSPLPRLISATKTSGLFSSSTDNDEAAKLLEKAAQLRAEIAAMEGKTVEEVEGEARQKKEDARLRKEQDEARKKEEKANNKNSWKTDGRFLEIPNTPEDMVRQAARSVERAFQDGIARQTVRFALIREDQYISDLNEWPGGAKQMARESAKPLTKALLKQIHAPTKNVEEKVDIRLPPTVKEQDIWDFDGSALITAEAAAGANGDVQALVFPNTDVKYIKDIETIDEAMGKRLFLLINPFWRNLDSWGINLLALGAKQKAEEVIFNRGYNETYSLLRFSCRGEECVALKAYPYDWQLYAYREDEDNYIGGVPMETAIRLGSSKEEPSTELITELLNQRPEFKDTRNMRQLRKFKN